MLDHDDIEYINERLSEPYTAIGWFTNSLLTSEGLPERHEYTQYIIDGLLSGKMYKGDPCPTYSHTSEQLKSIGYVGIYRKQRKEI